MARRGTKVETKLVSHHDEHQPRSNSEVVSFEVGVGEASARRSSGRANAKHNVREKKGHIINPAHLVVQHNYHDHAQDAVLALPSTDNSSNRKGCRLTQSFPYRLYDMIESLQAEGQEDVFGWQPHGRCFVVRQPEALKQLLPRYFRLSKIQSFQRQLK